MHKTHQNTILLWKPPPKGYCFQNVELHLWTTWAKAKPAGSRWGCSPVPVGWWFWRAPDGVIPCQLWLIDIHLRWTSIHDQWSSMVYLNIIIHPKEKSIGSCNGMRVFFGAALHSFHLAENPPLRDPLASRDSGNGTGRWRWLDESWTWVMSLGFTAARKLKPELKVSHACNVTFIPLLVRTWIDGFVRQMCI